MIIGTVLDDAGEKMIRHNKAMTRTSTNKYN
jgi:hypothetical protein